MREGASVALYGMMVKRPHAWAWALLTLSLLADVTVRLRLLGVPLTRDEGEYAYFGQLLLQGDPPYKTAYNFKLPGIYGVYAGILAAFGQTAAGIHFGLLVANIAGCALVFLLATRLFTPVAGVVAGTTFAALSLTPRLTGWRPTPSTSCCCPHSPVRLPCCPRSSPVGCTCSSRAACSLASRSSSSRTERPSSSSACSTRSSERPSSGKGEAPPAVSRQRSRCSEARSSHTPWCAWPWPSWARSKTSGSGRWFTCTTMH